MIWALFLALSLAEPPVHTDRAGELGAVGPSVEASGVVVRSVRHEGLPSTVVEAQLASGALLVLEDRGNPDRVAISADGLHAAWVSARTGLASVWVAEVTDDSTPRQLTNLGLDHPSRVPGSPPDGWVAPPIDHSLHFDGDWLVWTGPNGEIRRRWR